MNHLHHKSTWRLMKIVIWKMQPKANNVAICKQYDEVFNLLMKEVKIAIYFHGI